MPGEIIAPSAMKAVPLEDPNSRRLAALERYGILDTPPESQFDSIVELAKVLFDTPIAALSLVDQKRQWFKARIGLDAQQTPREESFCSHAMENSGVFVVPDARLDPRFADHPAVVGGVHIRFYAGAPLRSPDGENLGALCVISSNPRGDFSAADRHKLSILADIVVNEMELRKQAQDARGKVEDRDFALRDAHLRIKNSLDYATLLAEVQSEDISIEALTAIAMAAWKQYVEAGGVVNSSVKSLRARMTADEYRHVLGMMPGFSI